MMEYRILCTIGDEIQFSVAGESRLVNLSDLNDSDCIDRIYRLQFSGAPKRKYFETALKILKENPHIDLRFYGNYSEDLIDWESLSFIENLYVDLWTISELKGLSRLVNLKKLGIAKNVKSTVSLSVLKDLKNLEILYTSISKDIIAIAELKKLKFISLREIKTANIDFLRPLENLEELWLSLGSYENIDSIQDCEKLNKLSIHQIRGIDNENLNRVISKCSSIVAIELQNLKQLTSIQFVEKLKDLNYIRLDTNNNILTFEPIAKSNSIETISTTKSRPMDRNLTYLSRIENVMLGDKYSKKEVEDLSKSFLGRNLCVYGIEIIGTISIEDPFEVVL